MPRKLTPEVACSTISRNVAVIGSGYVGLSLSASLALLGHVVECTDKSGERVAQLTAGQVPITEAGLTELVQEMIAASRLRFGVDNVRSAANAEFVFLCLPTPNGADGSADLSFVKTVVAEIGPHLKSGATVITKSTVPVGTGELVASVLGRSDVNVVSNPEFLAEGSALNDCLFPDRIVLGAHSVAAAREVAELYGPFGYSRSIFTDIASAELIKYAANAYLATRLTFVNSMAELCEAVGADVRSVMAGMGSDHRIGAAFLQPGPGWGGSCFPKDTQALVSTAEQFGCEFSLIKTAIAENTHHTMRIVQKVITALGDVAGRRIAMWGLTFKAGTDDLRNSPALMIAQRLVELGASVQAYDPTVCAGTLYGMEVHSSSFSACRDTDALVIGTEWPEFLSSDLSMLRTSMSGRVIVDARNVLDSEAAAREGFLYLGIGTRADSKFTAEVVA